MTIACKNCAYWNKYFERGCEFPDTIFSVANKNMEMEVIATAADDTNLNAYLKTGPDFFCAHFHHDLEQNRQKEVT